MRWFLSICTEFGSPSTEAQISNIGSGNSLILTRLNASSKPFTLFINSEAISTIGTEWRETDWFLSTQIVWEGSTRSALAAASSRCCCCCQLQSLLAGCERPTDSSPRCFQGSASQDAYARFVTHSDFQMLLT